MFVPARMFVTKGVGRHREQLSSFELALRDASIAAQNIVSVSSILPPRCKRVSVEEGVRALSAGEITFAVMARNATNEPNRLIAASIGVAQPADPARYGYLSEHHPFGETDEKAGDYAEDLAATMLASTLGIEFDPDAAWDEREKVFGADRACVQRHAERRRRQAWDVDDGHRRRGIPSLTSAQEGGPARSRLLGSQGRWCVQPYRIVPLNGGSGLPRLPRRANGHARVVEEDQLPGRLLA